jgi:hypothetical protein
MSLNTSNIIHIVVEVVTLLAITVYFLQQNRKMMNLIDSLTDKVDEQDEKIEKHDKVIADILKTINKTNTVSPTSSFITSSTSASLPISSPVITTTSSKPLNICFGNSCETDFEETEDEHEEEEVDHDHEHEDEEEEEQENYHDEEVIHETSKVEELEDEPVVVEIIEEPPPPPVVIIEDVKETSHKKKRKKKKKTPSMIDIDKELEDELNDLYKEEIMASH